MAPIFDDVSSLPSFDKDLKRLSKKYRTLPDDLDTFIDVEMKLFHKLNIDNGGIVQISGLGVETPKVYKVLRFACKSLKGTGSKSGIRITYAYDEGQDSILFVEMYYKGDKENEDRKKILDFLKSLT